MNKLVAFFIDGPERLSAPLLWLGPLAARICVGWTFMWSGWEKLNSLPQMIQNFTEWGIPAPAILTPFASGAEMVFGFLLLVGLFTRIAGPGLVVVILVAIFAAKRDQIDSLESFLNLDETAYLAIFGWLAIAGPGPISVDYWLQRWTHGAPQARVEGLTAAT